MTADLSRLRRFGNALRVVSFLSVAGVALTLLAAATAAEPLQAEVPLLLPSTHGKFDFITIDPVKRRLVAAHTENGSVDVVDLDHGNLLKSVSVGAAQACVVDTNGSRYFVSVSQPPQLVVLDAARLEVLGIVALAGPGDLLAWHEASATVYVCHDDGSDVWAISPTTLKVVGTVALPSESPEDLRFDEAGKRLFQAMKTAATVEVIKVETKKIIASWPTAPAESPHGMATVSGLNALLVAGGNGKLVLLSQEDGRLLATADIPTGVDEIAYDSDWHRVYCASGTGKISVHRVEEGRLVALGEVFSSPGARSIALDPKTHNVWIAFPKDGKSYVQSFTVRP